MNIFSSLPFLQDFPGHRPAANSADSYARGYGNRVASADRFATLGHGHGRPEARAEARAGAKVEARKVARTTATGARSPAIFLNDPCPLGACG